MHVPSQKLDEKAIKCIFLGIDVVKNGYKCFDVGYENLYILKSIKIDKMQNWKTFECDVQMPLSSKVREMDQESDVDDEKETNDEKINDYVEDVDINHGTTTSQLRRSSRVRKPIQRLTNDSCIVQHYLFMAKVNEFIEPNCFEDGREKREWKCAMQKEIDSLHKNDTWKLATRANDKKVIGCEWVYRSTLNFDGTLNRCKVQLVAKGYSQVYGLDYEEIFSPITKNT